jgi:hypothetical protein
MEVTLNSRFVSTQYRLRERTTYYVWLYSFWELVCKRLVAIVLLIN